MKTKKVLTILMVLALVAGFAFADDRPAANTTETHKITVNTTVNTIVPVFGFVSANNVVTNNTVKFNQSTVTTGDDFTVEDAAILYSSNKDITEAALSETFLIKSQQVCNIYQDFEFTVSATRFVRQTTQTDTVAYTTAGDPTIALKAPTTAIAATEHVSVSATGTTKLTASFTGRQVTAGITLGSVDVTWPQDPDAKPGSYKADVVLTVTAK